MFFYRTAQNLVQNLGMPTGAIDKLKVPALIRNLHANGIHHGFQNSSTSVSIAGVTYDFTHGAPVQCADWEYIAHALENSVQILERILNTPQVIQISHIADAYAVVQSLFLKIRGSAKGTKEAN